MENRGIAMFTKAEEVITIIEQRKNRGLGLQHFREYMASIGNPHKLLNSIHVAGTNGKGSTTNDIRSILQVAGYKVGSFTSPYMITHLDRIRINDVNIGEKEFVDISNRFYESWIAWDLSMFEIDMAIACLYYQQQHVDYCVFEVGLGGRLDATNILIPLVSVITNIGMDHMEYLGNTYEQIAEEKAGIIKDHVDVITAEDKSECLAIFQKHANKAKAHCIQIHSIENVKKNDFVSFDYGEFKHIELYSQAIYQCKNAALAIETLLYLKANKQVKLKDEDIYQGLKQALWMGRFEIMNKNPLVILDGAHNTDGIHALVESLKDQKDISVIFSVLKDKNFHEMLEELESITHDITICHFQNERVLDIQVLKNRPFLTLKENYEEAIDEAMCTKNCIVITGSLYFISEVRKYMMKKVAKS